MTPSDNEPGTRGLTVGAGVAQALVDFATARGADRGTLLRRAGVDAADLLHPDDRVPVAGYRALIAAAKVLCRDPAFALHFGAEVDLSEMSIVGLLDPGIETMADAIAQVNRYASLVMETGCRGGDRLAIEQRPNEVWLVDRRALPNGSPELTESTLARIAGGMRRFFGDGHPLKAVHVTHPAPEHHGEYRRVFGAPVVFESEENALVFDAARWPRRIGTEPTYVSRVLGTHADRLLRDLEQSKSTRGRVERALMARLRAGETGMDAVAAELGVSRPTLARRLKAEGVTFAAVLDDLRRTLALDGLLDAGLSVKETAYLVGFSEPAPFSRAFKRWTGLSPRAYVAKAREER